MSRRNYYLLVDSFLLKTGYGIPTCISEKNYNLQDLFQLPRTDF